MKKKSKKKKNVLVTGCAGFIGFHTVSSLLNSNKDNIFGIDNVNNYYDVNLKKQRLKIICNNKNFSFTKLDIRNREKLNNYFKLKKIDHVIHLAAQAGVRHSIRNPSDYVDNNLIGFFNVLEASRKHKIKHLVFASTSSVYGNNKNYPLKESLSTEKPLSFYAATKKSNEVMAYSYSNIYNLPCTGLRFFTAYGPLGRPDMSLYKFTDKIMSNKVVTLYNDGFHIRDFTYVDDVVTGILKVLHNPSRKKIPYDNFNIASGNPKTLKVFLKEIEKNIGKKARIKYKGLQQGDIYKTHADISKINKKFNYKPFFDIPEGIKRFVVWYKNKVK